MGNRYATSMHSQRKLNLKHWTQPGVSANFRYINGT